MLIAVSMTNGCPFCGRSRNRTWNPPTSSSLAEEKHLGSPLLSTAVRDFPTLAAVFRGD
jgi:hypothetical protein